MVVLLFYRTSSFITKIYNQLSNETMTKYSKSKAFHHIVTFVIFLWCIVLRTSSTKWVFTACFIIPTCIVIKKQAKSVFCFTQLAELISSHTIYFKVTHLCIEVTNQVYMIHNTRTCCVITHCATTPNCCQT